MRIADLKAEQSKIHNPTSAIPILSPLDKLMQGIGEELIGLRDRDLLRTLTTIEAIRGAEVRLNGRWLVCWCANDYLGLSTHPKVVRAACEAATQWGLGARASRLLAGSTRLHAQLEERVASFFRAEAALVFSSGYLTNLGTLSALLAPEDVVLVDRLAHASLIDACRASRARLRVFPHNDVAELSRLLARLPAPRQRSLAGQAGRRVVVTEGVFSMDGDRAPLSELLDVVTAHDALLYLDDAHGAFVVGATGRGSPEAAGVSHDAMLYMGTLGKALGCQGGFVVGPRALIEFLQNRARQFIYATALAVPVVAGALEALRLVEDDPSFRTQLSHNIQRFHAHLRSLERLREVAPSHIIPIIVGSSRRARELSDFLQQRGMWAPAIRPPTVPEGTARLRISLSALHTEPQIDQLAEALEAWVGG